MKDLIDTADIAELLKVDRRYVTDRLTKRPDFPAPCVNLNRKVRRWNRADVEDYLRHRRAAISSADSR